MRVDRRQVIGAALLAVAPARAAKREWRALADEVRAEMAWAWDQYRRHAWGKDELLPISGGASSFTVKGRHVGLTLIEALDTLWVTGLDRQFADGIAWVKAHADWDIDGEVSVFETNIRLVGGLLSAHHASGDPVLLASARDLADRLLPAFDTPTGIPYGTINLRTGKPGARANSPAGAGTFLTEWGTLSRLTGDPRYHDAAKRAVVALFERRSKLDLLPVRIDVVTGQWLDRRATVGSYGDSYYEYLWDAWQLLGDADCKRMYDICTAAILRHQQDWRDGRLWFTDVDYRTGVPVNARQDELASFYGGLLAQGGRAREGKAYTESWASVQTRFGVLPEEYDYLSTAPTQLGNALRPELADAAFNLWLLDRDERWRHLAADHFRAMKRWNRAAHGYADLADVTTKRQADHCPGYWWSEQMKYYYLIFADTPRFDYRRNYLSTEGNVLLGFRRGRPDRA